MDANEVRYLTDDRDFPDHKLTELVISTGGNGDWYIATVPKGDIPFGRSVRLCTSGGASSEAPGLCVAIAKAFAAIQATRPAPDRAKLEGGAPMLCPHCSGVLLWSEDRGAHCDGCDDYDSEEEQPESEGETLNWGVEETKQTLWIGPMRSDGKVNEIVCYISVDGLKPESVKLAKQRAHLIAQSVNHSGRQSDTIRGLENVATALRAELAEAKASEERSVEFCVGLTLQPPEKVREAFKALKEKPSLDAEITRLQSALAESQRKNADYLDTLRAIYSALHGHDPLDQSNEIVAGKMSEQITQLRADLETARRELGLKEAAALAAGDIIEEQGKLIAAEQQSNSAKDAALRSCVNSLEWVLSRIRQGKAELEASGQTNGLSIEFPGIVACIANAKSALAPEAGSKAGDACKYCLCEPCDCSDDQSGEMGAKG